MTVAKRITTFILCLALVLIVGGEAILSAFALRTEAATSSYSNVLDDLEKDDSFNPDDYPAIANDYSLQVITIAEGENGELFVYVYQPSDATKDLRASYINMSLQAPENRNPTYGLYSLTWLNSDGVFDKYIVNDFTVSNNLYRYYDIATVYRAYDSSIDTSSTAVDTTQGVGYPVGRIWCAYYYNDMLIYEMEEVDVVDINIQATGSIRYTEGFKLYIDKCDSHYVAFSIGNYDVDKIYDADITYTIREYTYYYFTAGNDYKEPQGESYLDSCVLTESDTASNDGDGLLGKKYTWNRIQDVSTFIQEATNDANEEFSEEELIALNNSEFVFRFLETDYTLVPYVDGSGYYVNYCETENVGVLRLKFLSQGKVYNLGCVSELVGTDSIPELEVSIADNIENSEWWQKIMMVLGLILIVVLILLASGPLGFVFNIIWTGIKFIVKFLFAILTFPFKVIGWLFKFK
ncbi:MAG: hypothetical protein IJY65_05540 [Clostridia bacterium]|nr:hypothetical protein [Clostridia bacterium]